ncbi:MAG: hypothetical protein BGP12_05050 [Rhodospirillales bacterium 70-18]|nr:hypothetical protein [Rhodospirillales bacterium]OJY65089.1 MAG: hypothetical protein BGP12_05050 [Rhodospirillales bacterium 70-18]
MTLAVLVLAYTRPAVLRATVDMFAGSGATFFVHVDAKAELSAFAALQGRPDVVFIEDRQTVFWGGFNMVLAEIALIRHALRHAAFDRLVLISDDTVPIKAIGKLTEALAAPTLWIVQNSLPEFRWRYDAFCYFDSLATSPRHVHPRERLFGPPEFADLRDMMKLHQAGKQPLDRLVHGPQWWCLSGEVAAAVLALHDADSHRRESFRFSAIPDESYIHTLVAQCAGHWPKRGSPVFTDFDRDPKPYVFHNIDELAAAFASPRPFARKIAEDATLLAAIAARVAQG